MDNIQPIYDTKINETYGQYTNNISTHEQYMEQYTCDIWKSLHVSILSLKIDFDINIIKEL